MLVMMTVETMVEDADVEWKMVMTLETSPASSNITSMFHHH
jgi:hypothetical protein